MKPLARNNIDTRTSGLETRVDALERRIIPTQGWAWATAGRAGLGLQSLTSGQFVHPGFGSFVSTSDDHIFTHLPVVTAWDPGATTNIDGSLVILQRGVYSIFGWVTWNLSPRFDAQLYEVEVVMSDINDPTGTPVAAAPFAQVQNVGSLSAINAQALGVNLDAGKQFSHVQRILGSGSFFTPVAVKVMIRSGGPNTTLVSSWGMTIQQISPLLCGQGNFPFITDDGIPSDWEDDADCG